MPQQSSDQDLSQERLEKLSNLQITLVQHAMSFPNLKRLSYRLVLVYWLHVQ